MVHVGGIMPLATVAAAVQTATANAPHLVLRFQKIAATRSGESAANPEKPYCTASAKMPGRAMRAMP